MVLSLRKLLFYFIVLASLKSYGQYSSENIKLLAHWDTSKTLAEPQYNIKYNSVWGWVDADDDKEYAILGSTDGTYIIDVSTPTKPIVKAYVPGKRDSCIWREYKTYKNYLYAVSDDALPNSLQIIDLSPLPDSVHVVYDQDTLAPRSHTIFIDELNAKMYLNSVFLNQGGHSNMAVFSLDDPTNPALLRRLEEDYPANDNVHDSYVRNDTCYASSSYSGLYIYKLNANNTFSQLASFSNYELGGAYNHNSALTRDSKTLVFSDEVPTNRPIKILNISDFNNIFKTDTFRSTPASTATPHNVFIPTNSNTRLVTAYYQDGLQIFDISNPYNVQRSGYFDTAPDDCPTCPYPSYSGCWGAYVELPSKIILASDMQNGLFVLDACTAMGNLTASITVTPVTCFDGDDGTATITPDGASAPYIYEWSNGATTQNVSDLHSGIYSVTVTTSSGCTNTFTVPVTGAPMIINTLTTTPASCPGCLDGSASVSPNGGIPPYSYVWDTGETTSTITGVEQGTYKVCVTDSNGCKKCDSVSIFLVDINNPNFNLSINIYPNPSNDNFVLYLPLQSSEKIAYKITDMMGSIVEAKELTMPAGDNKIIIANKYLPSGIYNLQVQGTNNLITRKLIKTQ